MNTPMETWTLTPKLRWKKPDSGILAMMQAAGSVMPVLQQQWYRNGDYKTEWRDVPTQREDEE